MNNFDPRPHRDCCWIQEGRLLAGAYPSTDAHEEECGLLTKHLDAGVTFFLDLTEEGEMVPYAKHLPAHHPVSGVPVVYKRIRMPDGEAPHSVRDMNQILDVIDSAMAEGHVIYVHCRHGVGRTGMVVGCYLVRHGMTGEMALEELSNLWRCRSDGVGAWRIPEGSEQRRYVVRFPRSHRATR